MKKKINIVLLVAVLSLWGTVLYKYVNQYFSKNELSVTRQQSTAKGSYKVIAKDTFQLQAIARDPFLNIATAERKVVTGGSRVRRSIAPATPKVVVTRSFPTVQYYGYIKSVNNSKELMLMSVDGKFMKLKLNEDVAGFKVLKFTGDSVNVYFQKATKWVRVSKR